MNQQAANLTTFVTLEAETCCNCGMAFGMPSGYRRELLNAKRGQMFYCPAGHPQHYTGKSEAARLKEQLAAQEEMTRYAREDALRQERFARAARGQVTKIKNRIKHGVCPCCKRTFVNVARHMTSKHPDYSKQDIG